MSVGVRPADLERDKAVIVETLRCFLNPHSDNRRFEWLYRDNPFGEASVWLAYEGKPDHVVGVAGAFPRRLHMLGGQKLSWVLGDFCVSDEHRTLGPALMLQRACLAGLEKQGASLSAPANVAVSTIAAPCQAFAGRSQIEKGSR
jgi:hypothetical protein